MEDLLKKGRQPTVLGVNVVYIIVLLLMLGAQLVLPLLLPAEPDGAGYYLRLFLLELLLIGGPPFVYLVAFRMDIRKTIRLRGLGPVEVLLILGMALFGYFVTILLNLVWYWVASHWGTPIGQELPSITTGREYLMAVLAIGLVPAVIEEFLFRGLILRGYEKYGARKAIVITGILFGALHLQLMSIPSIILLGIVISYVVYRTDSIFAGVLYHFLHNTTTVTILFMQNAALEGAEAMESMPQDFSQLPDDMLTMAFIIWGIIGFVAIILFGVCTVVFHRYTEGKGKLRESSVVEINRSNFFEMSPAILAMVIVAVGLAMEILYMSGRL